MLCFQSFLGALACQGYAFSGLLQEKSLRTFFVLVRLLRLLTFLFFFACFSISMTQTGREHVQIQDAQLSQRDRAAECVIVFAKSSRLELGDNNLRT